MTALADTLIRCYGLRPVTVTAIPAGTATDNYCVTDRDDHRWFAKTYRDGADLHRERAAIELAAFAREGGVPVPSVHPTTGGSLLQEAGPRPMSLWSYVDDAETAEGGLTGDRWSAVGTVVGRLHRRLSAHPAAAPSLRPAPGVRDIDRSRAGFDRLISRYGQRRTLDPFEEWVVEVARQRRALVDRAGAVLSEIPDLTEQIVHGDLAAPNLLLRGDTVAAMIDFQSPAPRSLAWEIARIGCDPRTVVLGDHWVAGLLDLLSAYRDEHPEVRAEDLRSAAAVGCAYTITSTYPLAEPLDNPTAVTPTLRAYARNRHRAALILLDRLDEIGELARERLR